MQSRSIWRSGQPTMCHRILECELLTGTWSAEGIMASGHVNRTNRPNTWPHRPACDVKFSLANSEPSTHGTSRTSGEVPPQSAKWAKPGHDQIYDFMSTRLSHDDHQCVFSLTVEIPKDEDALSLARRCKLP